MNFKLEYKKILEEAGSIGNLSEKSFINYKNKYSSPSVVDPLNKIMGGKIFTFYYKTETKPIEFGFINRRPLLFIESERMDFTKGIINGIDLMLLKPMDRFNFINRLLDIYEPQIKHNIARKQQAESSQVPLKINIEMMETLFGGINYKHAYAGFKINNIIGLKEIPMEDWAYIIYLNTKSIEGINIEEIYNKFK